MQTKLTTAPSALILLLSLCLNISAVTSATVDRPSVYVDPPRIKGTVNDIFSVNVNVSNITNLRSCELKLTYDCTILNCTGAEIPPGHFLDSQNNTYIVKNGEIHQDQGYVMFAAVMLSPEESRNGSGILGTMTFRVLNRGKCDLKLANVTLVESNGKVQEIPPEEYDVYDGYFFTPSKIYIDPSLIKAVVNDTFSINIHIADVANLWAYELLIKYNNTVLNCTSAEVPAGHFLDSNNTYVLRDGEIHQDEGYVAFNATLTAPEEPRNGSGVLGTVTFQVVKKGKCPIELYNTTIIESVEEMQEIPPEEYDISDGFFLMPSRIYVDPTTVKAPVWGTFSINVSIFDITNLYAYELGLKYNNTLLNCTHAEIPQGHFLDSLNNTYILKAGEIHQDEGYVWFAVTLTAPEEPRNGSGVLGTATFQVLRKDECPLEIFDDILLGYEGVISRDEYDVEHGYFIASFYGDLNGDGVVNMIDLSIVARAYLSRPGDPNWNPIADIAEPFGIVNIIDVAAVAKERGKTL